MLFALLVMAGCTTTAPPAPTPISLQPGESRIVNVPAGRYRFDWTSTCTSFFLTWSPTAQGVPEIDVSNDPSGSKTLELPAGPAYVNRGGICPANDYVVTITPAA